MNPILLARHVRESLRELVHTTLNTTSPAFAGMVDRFLAEQRNFIKGPWVSVDMPFRQAIAADGIWQQPFPELPLGFAPYRHQVAAFERLGGGHPRSTLIATGTGSGKTECYLWPILDHCRREKGKPGIKAILIYPMNALATDQARRLATALTSIPSLAGIRAGIYADAQPRDATHEVTPESIITHRDAMRADPPDILLTNYKMLDYLLLRGQDRTLWEANAPETLRFLVVDEIHTFDGAQGADLALLLRRLKHRLRTPEDHLVCVGSSATLGAGDAAVAELRDYAETIFGEAFDSEAVVREVRKRPGEVFGEPEYFEWPAPESVQRALADAEDLDQPGAARRLAECLFADDGDDDIAELLRGDASDPAWRLLLGRLLLKHHICQYVLKIISERPGPSPIEEIAIESGQAKAAREWAPADHRALAELVVSLVAWARSGTSENPRPLFNVRLQLWVREMARMVTDLPRRQEGSELCEINLFHAGDLDRQSLRRMLPIVNCNRCGSAAHVGRQQPKEARYGAPLDQIYEEFFEDGSGDRIRLFYHESIERKINAAAGGNRIVKGWLDPDTLAFQPGGDSEAAPGSSSPVWMYAPMDNQGRMDRTCPACGHAQGLILFGMRSARMTAGITGALYASMQNEEDAAAKPRFLMFSDSVQDAAQRAAVTETRNVRSVNQKSLYSALRASETDTTKLDAVIDALPARYLNELGGDDFTALFIAKEQTWRKSYRELSSDGLSIDDPIFLEHMKIRLGWEYFADLTYRSHLPHSLEGNGVAVADVPVSRIHASAEKLAGQIRNEFPATDPIDPVVLAGFAAGVLRQMRRQGSVGHRYVAAGIATDSRGRGLNYYGAANRLGLGRSRTLPLLDHRRVDHQRGLAPVPVPVPVTLRRGLDGFECIGRDHVANWYRDWLFRTLAPTVPRVATEPETVYRMLMQRLEADAIIRRVDRPGEHSGSGYLIEPDRIAVSTSVTPFECTVCKRREIGLTANSALLEGSPCTRIGCEGYLVLSDLAPRPALRRALGSDRNHRVAAREHTSLLEADDRLRIETGFIKEETRWAPNLISATPTLEMGIDIGDLSTVLLCSVPPEETNYVQRMGRSGRRDGNALNLVLANARSHDLQFWEDPTPMLAGQVKTPGVYIAAEAVLLRQAAAFTLDVYVASEREVGDYGKVGQVLKRKKDGGIAGFPFDWLALVEESGSAYAAAFLGLLPGPVQERRDLAGRITAYLTARDDASLAWHVSRVFDEAADDRNRLMEKRSELTREMERLRRRRTELTDKEFQRRENDIARDRKEINRLIRSGIDDVPVLKFLTDRGVLPNYAFPEEGVKLTSILSRRDETAEDDGLLYIEYSRPGSSALSELALGQTFYANGRQVEIERIDMSQDDLSVWKFCQNCSFVVERHQGDHSPCCPRCGDDMWSDTGSDHEVVLLKSVIAVDSEDKAAIRDADRRQQQQFDRAMVPFHDPGETGASWYTKESDSAPFGFEFVANCTFRDFNFGRRTSAPFGPKIAGNKRLSQPFQICRHCGSLQKPFTSNDDRGTHATSCPVNRDPDMARKDWEAETFLMRGFKTEAIRIVIPVAGQIDDDDVKSFVAGINLGLRRHFAGKVDHIRSTVVEALLDGVATVRSLYLYDSVPGGSGYLRQIGEDPRTMRAVITKAAEALRDCPCALEEETGCYRCVKSYRSQFGPGEPDRDRALEFMESILRNWNTLSRTTDGIDGSIRGSLVESELERRFLDALSRAYPDALKPQVLSGGRRGFVLQTPGADGPRLWNIEPQVQIDKRFKGLPKKRVDFLMTPAGRSADRPIVVETDGLEYHASSVAEDLLDRLAMIRSGHVRVWSLSWHDLSGEKAAPALNPLREEAMPPALIGQLSKVLSHPNFAPLAEQIAALRQDDSFQALRRILEGMSDLNAARSVLLRGLAGMGRPFDDLPRIAAVTEEGRQFLAVPAIKGHVVDQQIDLYIACDKVSPGSWINEVDDLRVLVRGTLPPVSPSAPVSSAYTEAWRGLWRLVNVLHPVKGFHVEFEGLEILSPPDLLTTHTDPENEMWLELKSLSDEAFHPLIDAMIAAGMAPPDLIGHDIVQNGRVVGMMEFGWSAAQVAVVESAVSETNFHLVAFAPDTGSVGETVARILEALGGVRG